MHPNQKATKNLLDLHSRHKIEFLNDSWFLIIQHLSRASLASLKLMKV